MKVTKGLLCVQVGSSEITNFDYHTGAPLAGKRGESQEVRIPFKEMKRAWSEQTALNPKSITSVNLVSFGTAKDGFASGWIMGSASLRGDVDAWAGLLGGFQTLSTLPAGIFRGSHLWFLYYLAMITVLTLALRGLVIATGSWQDVMVRRADALVAWLANSPGSLVILAVPTAAALWFMRYWGMDTPDQSLRPHVPVLAIYGGLFVLGWMLSRQRELISQFARLTPLRWIEAGLGVAAILLLGEIERDPGHPTTLLRTWPMP